MRAAMLVLFLSLVSVGRVHAQASDDPDSEESLALAIGGAAMSSGMVAFDGMLLTRTDEAFGPRLLVDASFGLSIAGAIGAHLAAFALVSRDVRHDRIARAVFSGISLISSGLSVLSFALPTGWAITSDPPTGENAIALVCPYLLGAIGLAAIFAGGLVIDGASAPPINLAASVSPTGASIQIGGRF